MSWTEPERWAESAAGITCGMCDDAHLETNPFSDLIAELSTSYARLARNQTHAGYCVVVSKRHVTELHQLSPADLAGFWSDVARVGRAIFDTFLPVKLDYLVMGHRMPHLHCHVYPQYPADDPFAPVDIAAGDLTLDPAEQAARIRSLRAAVGVDRR